MVPEALPTSGTVIGQIIDYSNKEPVAGARVRSLTDANLEIATDANGQFRLVLPPGEHTIVLFSNGYTFANREVTITPYIPESVGTIELVPLDDAVTSIGSAGGTAENGVNNTNVVFSAGAVDSTKAVRLTELPVDEFTGDFAALPGPFTDGSIPMGFVLFEPDGTDFSAPLRAEKTTLVSILGMY